MSPPEERGVCPQHYELQREVREGFRTLGEKVDGLISGQGEAKAALREHVARHQEREAISAQGFKWSPVLAGIIQWAAIATLTAILLILLAHSSIISKVFGG